MNTHEPSTYTQWYGIYYRDREFARVMGDPLLHKLLATSKADAEARAYALGIDDHHAGLWAHPLPPER